MKYKFKNSFLRKSVYIVLCALGISLLLINLLVKNPVFKSDEERAEFAMESKQYALAEETYLRMIQKDTFNIDLYYRHLYAHFSIPKEKKTGEDNTEIRDDNTIFSFYESKTASGKLAERDIGFYGLGLYYHYLSQNRKALDCFKQVHDRKLKYLNNSTGHIYLEKKLFKNAEDCFLKEIENRGNLSGAYFNLLNLYLETKQLAKAEKIIHEGKVEYFSGDDLSEYYFKSGKVFKYFKSFPDKAINNVDIKSFIAAMLIMLVWLFYLRRIDSSRPEKWKYVISTFILGALFSYGTFFLTDINNHIIGFKLNGEVVNDFFYCFLGIGLIEESVKLLPFLIMLKFTREVDEPVDYIIYPSISALGFAFAENILYFHHYGMDIIHGRAMISVVIHMFCSSIIGYGVFFGFRKINLTHKVRVLVFLLIAAFIHGFFDFWLINDKVSDLRFFSFVLAIFGLSLWNSFINLCLNHIPPENLKTQIPDHKKLKDYLIYGLSSILIFEYLIISISYGPKVGNASLMDAGISGAYLIVFLSQSLSNTKLHRDKSHF